MFIATYYINLIKAGIGAIETYSVGKHLNHVIGKYKALRMVFKGIYNIGIVWNSLPGF